MKVREVMTENVKVVDQSATLMEAVSIMRDMDVGFIPVTDGSRITGIVTDRDIALRAVAAGGNCGSMKVEEVMSREIYWVSGEATLAQAVEVMEEHKVRRLPVRDGENRLIGIISLGDIAVKADLGKAAEALERISEPAHPVR